MFSFLHLDEINNAWYTFNSLFVKKVHDNDHIFHWTTPSVGLDPSVFFLYSLISMDTLFS